VALSLTVDGEVDLVRGMVELLHPLLDLVVLVEATRTFQGGDRDVVGDGWVDLLPIESSAVRSVVVDLPPAARTDVTMRRREMLQRHAMSLAVRDLDPDDLLLAADADEYVDPAWLRAHAGGVKVPTRLLMVPMYGGLDRRAHDWHCCVGHLTSTIGQWPQPETDWLYQGAVIGPISTLQGRGVSHWRSFPDAHSEEPAGWHLLHMLPPDGDPARKLARQAHIWDPHADTEYMRRLLRAGVHPYGWWLASAMSPPPALDFLRERHPELVLGALPTLQERRSLQLEALQRFQLASDLLGGDPHEAGRSRC